MSEDFDRRQILVGAAATATLSLTGCGTTGLGETGRDDDTGAGTGSVTTDWATGGTASMASDYAVDFEDETCSQTCELTLGPCYAETEERQDISEGNGGLPTRVALRIVDEDCNPVSGAVVDIWHCSAEGLYSGEDAAQMCTENDADALAGRWFRGTQTTDDDGVATFDTCMPGWYPSRAVHIHMQVRRNGQAWLTSQLGFPEALLSDVFDNHPVYSPFGQPDTPNASDNILGRDLSSYLFRWRQADDGALVVWKTLTLRGALSDSTC